MTRKHFASLDGLRGLAILLVVFYHYIPHRGVGLLGFLSSASWCGVDLFFVLSGFLITGILFDTQGAPSYFRNFYMRRTLRLVPVYAIFIALVFLFSPPPAIERPFLVGHPRLHRLRFQYRPLLHPRL